MTTTAKKFSSLAVAVLFAATGLLTGCQGVQNAPKQTGGTLLGGLAGGVLGSQIGGGAGKTAAIIGGTLLGGYLGSEVGKSLDSADQAALGRTTNSALERAPNGAPTTWNNPNSGNSGTVVPTSTYYEGNTPCRAFTSTVVVNGRSEPVRGNACRDQDGNWRVTQ